MVSGGCMTYQTKEAVTFGVVGVVAVVAAVVFTLWYGGELQLPLF